MKKMFFLLVLTTIFTAHAMDDALAAAAAGSRTLKLSSKDNEKRWATAEDLFGEGYQAESSNSRRRQKKRDVKLRKNLNLRQPTFYR